MEKRIQKLNENELEKVTGGNLEALLTIGGIFGLGSLSIAATASVMIVAYKWCKSGLKSLNESIDKLVKVAEASASQKN